MPAILYKELSYQLVGILFSVHNELGNRYQEKYYQRAIEEALATASVRFTREISVDLQYNGKNIGSIF